MIIQDESWSTTVTASTDTFKEGPFWWRVKAKFQPVGISLINLIGGSSQGPI